MRFLKSLVLYFIAFLITLICCDLFVSLSEIENPGLNELDEKTGRKRRANLSYTMFTEGFSIGQFNSFNYLGPDYPSDRNVNSFRIALLGDSYVEGFQLFDRQHFRSILETELNNKLSLNVEVLNFGRSGFDLADMYVYYENFVKGFNPDLTLIFLSNSDLECKQTDKAIPRLLNLNDRLEIRFSANYGTEFQVLVFEKLYFSRVLQMLNNCRKLINRGFLLPKLLDKLYSPISHSNMYSAKKLQTNDLIFDINKSLSNQGYSKFCILNRGEAALSSIYTNSLHENKLKYININDTLDTFINEGIDVNYWDATNKRGHWNAEAHNAIGHFLADRIIQEYN